MLAPPLCFEHAHKCLFIGLNCEVSTPDLIVSVNGEVSMSCEFQELVIRHDIRKLSQAIKSYKVARCRFCIRKMSSSMKNGNHLRDGIDSIFPFNLQIGRVVSEMPDTACQCGC